MSRDEIPPPEGGAHGNERRPEASGQAGAGGCPFHLVSFGRTPGALRKEALERIRTGRAFGFARAKELLLGALAKDPLDLTGETRYLLGLVCFHLEQWAESEMHLLASLRNTQNPNPSAGLLLRHVQTNRRTRVDRGVDPLPPFDPAELRRPPALALRKPELSDKRVPAAERRGLFSRLVSWVIGVSTRFFVGLAWLCRDRTKIFDFESWDRRSTLRGLLEIGGRRHDLNGDKLQSTYEGALVGHQPAGQLRPAWTERFRTATGAWTTDDPMEGAAGSEIQCSGAPLGSPLRRNRVDDDLPSPREVSRRILAPLENRPRQEVPFLNLLAIAWIQAQLHDWVSHKPTPLCGTYPVALQDDDPLRERYGIGCLHVHKSAPNPLDPARPHLSEVTHWWDASHLYGSDQRTQDRLRKGPDGRFLAHGKMRIDAGDLLPLNAHSGIEDTGFARNWWVGLDLMHTLFVKHHNFICDELVKEPAGKARWTSDELFHTARLINCAIMAKIHTVEWTPAVLPNSKLAFGMATNWWGMLEARRPFYERRLKRDGEPVHHVVGGIAGGERDHAGKPYGMSEEFTEVYRLHAGIPDAIRISPLAPGQGAPAVPTDATRGCAARAMVRDFGMATLLNSFGHQHMPALVNNNYPAFMAEMSVPGQPVIDIGTIDILRARERGVPAYNDFREMLGLKRISRFEDLGCSAETVQTLEKLYRGDVDKMDLLAGTSCELWRPENFGFGETMFTVFIQMASRRLHADPFYTEKLNERYYTRTGMDLIEGATFKRVLLRHYPELEACGLGNVHNAFEPWGTSARTHPHEHPLEQIVKY